MSILVTDHGKSMVAEPQYHWVDQCYLSAFRTQHLRETIHRSQPKPQMMTALIDRFNTILQALIKEPGVRERPLHGLASHPIKPAHRYKAWWAMGFILLAIVSSEIKMASSPLPQSFKPFSPQCSSGRNNTSTQGDSYVRDSGWPRRYDR